jgi:hypothetical protein
MSRGSDTRPDRSAGTACLVVVALPGAAATLAANNIPQHTWFLGASKERLNH